MKWTKERPTEPGWYWRKPLNSNPKFNLSVIIKLQIFSGELGYMGYGLVWDKYLWAGPIPEPKEEKPDIDGYQRPEKDDIPY